MKPIVCPIQTTQINWQVFIPLVEKLLERNIASGLDKQNKPIGDFASFIAALGELEQPDRHPDHILTNPGSLLRQLFFGFLIGGSSQEILKLILKSTLISTCEFAINDSWNSVVIVSGNLEQWRTAIINLLNEESSTFIREVFNEILMYFESIGLHRIWLEYSKVPLNDKTFYLK